MKTLELNQMESLVGGKDCLEATIRGGITGAIVSGLVSGGAAAPLGWFGGAVGGFIG
jgi:hypothetical protein